MKQKLAPWGPSHLVPDLGGHQALLPLYAFVEGVGREGGTRNLLQEEVSVSSSRPCPFSLPHFGAHPPPQALRDLPAQRADLAGITASTKHGRGFCWLASSLVLPSATRKPLHLETESAPDPPMVLGSSRAKRHFPSSLHLETPLAQAPAGEQRFRRGVRNHTLHSHTPLRSLALCCVGFFFFFNKKQELFL